MVYEPREDSYLMLEQVKRYIRKGDLLEVGTGSGVLAFEAIKKADSVLAVDIDRAAISTCERHIPLFAIRNPQFQKKLKHLTFKHSDVFSDVRGKYDWIIFNPPYLPLDENEPEDSRLATTGGEKGHELLSSFLDSANNFLREEGKMLILFSSMTGKKEVEHSIAQNLFEFEKVSNMKIPFETLHVYLIKKAKILKKLESKGVRSLEKFTQGHRGLIFTGKLKGKKIAVKMQKPSSKASGTIDNEARKLKVLNKKGIGPKILFSGPDFFVYEFVEGDFVFDFIEKAEKPQILNMFHAIMEQMQVLDKMKLNKEEMTNPYKHILVNKTGKKPVLLDFERCKDTLKPHNVTQFCQFITSGAVDNAITNKDIKFKKNTILGLAKKYKSALVRGNDYKSLFAEIMAELK